MSKSKPKYRHKNEPTRFSDKSNPKGAEKKEKPSYPLLKILFKKLQN